MNIVVVGAGVVGSSIAEQLVGPNNHISLIDVNPGVSGEIAGRLDVYTITGKGSYPNLLKEAGIASADMVIAVTPNDETNLLICSFASQFGVERRIARIRADEYTDPESGISLEELGVTCVIQPEKEVVRYILQLVELPGVTQTANIQSDTVCIRGYVLDDDMPLTNTTLKDIDKLPGFAPMLIISVIREGSAIVPTGNVKLLPGDEIITIMPGDSLPSFKKLLNVPNSKLERVVVYGDSLTAAHLVSKLSGMVDRLTLVDRDMEHGRKVAASCSGVEVLHGNCTSADILQDIHVDKADFFISAGTDSEDNIMAALLAKAEGAKDVAAIRDDARHIELFEILGLKHIVVPRIITSEKIMESIHVLPIGTHLKLKNIDQEVTQFQTTAKSRIVGKPLNKLDKLFKKSIVIAGIIRNGQMIIPNGNTIIIAGDTVLVLCAHKNLGIVNRLF